MGVITKGFRILSMRYHTRCFHLMRVIAIKVRSGCEPSVAAQRTISDMARVVIDDPAPDIATFQEEVGSILMQVSVCIIANTSTVDYDAGLSIAASGVGDALSRQLMQSRRLVSDDLEDTLSQCVQKAQEVIVTRFLYSSDKKFEET